MERSEHFKETKAGLFCRLDPRDDIGVPRRVEIVFHFIYLQCAVAVRIKLVESLRDKALAQGIQLSTECSKELIETYLTITTGIENIKEALSITSTHAWHSVVVKNSLELTQAEFTGAIAIHYSKLLFEANQTLGTLSCNPLLELIDDQLMLSNS